MEAPEPEWIEQWLSLPRWRVYLTAADGDHNLALELYEWNASVAASLHRDLAHVEIALRNAYDRVLCAGQLPGEPHWVFNPHHWFPRDPQRAANGRWIDRNETPRTQITNALHQVRGSRRSPNRTDPAPGKVLAELPMGFWRYLSSRRHHDRLWIPYLHTAFPRGTSRLDVDRPVGRLHELRNRVAHHEPLLRTHLAARYRDALSIAELISSELAAHLKTTSSVPELLTERPC